MYGTDISSRYSRLAKVTASAVRGQSASQNLRRKKGQKHTIEGKKQGHERPCLLVNVYNYNTVCAVANTS